MMLGSAVKRGASFGTGRSSESSSPAPGTPSALGVLRPKSLLSTAFSTLPTSSHPLVSGTPATTPPSRTCVQCHQCRQTLPMSLCTPKGAQWWCLKDNSSYAQLQIRWSKNAKVREWWQKQQPEQKVAWFLRWQGLSAANKFENVDFTEQTVKATGTLFDEIDKWDCWESFYSRKIKLPGSTDATVLAEWKHGSYFPAVSLHLGTRTVERAKVQGP